MPIQLPEGVTRETKTLALSLLIQHYTGSKPIIERHDDYNEIILTPEQIKIMQDSLSQKHDPGNVRLDWKPVIVPWMIKNYGIAVVASILVLVLLGRLTK